MNRPQVAYFLSGVLAHFPTGARKDGLEGNVYHAHATLPDQDPYTTALQLRQLFAKYGKIHKAVSPDAPQKRPKGFIAECKRLLNWAAKWIAKDRRS